MNSLKTIILVLCFPLLLIATLWGAVATLVIIACAILFAADTHVTFAWPLHLSDFLPHWVSSSWQLAPPNPLRPWHTLPADVETLWHNYAATIHDVTLTALPHVFGIALIALLLALRFESRLTEALAGTRVPAKKEFPQLSAMLDALCRKHDIKPPHLFIARSIYPNAYASGVSKNSYAITISAGLLATLDADEVQAVMAHELSHIQHGDVRLIVLVGVLTGLITNPALALWRYVVHSLMGYNTRYNKLAFSIPFVAIMALTLTVGAVMAELMKKLLLREREIMADAGAARLTGNGAAMASALSQLETAALPEGLPAFMQDAFIYRPIKGWRRLFSTHPTLKARQQALVLFGGRHTHGQTMVRLVTK